MKKQFFSKRLRILMIAAVVLAVFLAVLSTISGTNTTNLVQTVMGPIRSLTASVTRSVERFYNYAFHYESLEAENTVLKEKIASMEEAVEVDKVCCQVDILPTVSNLLGLEYDSRMLDGSDILSDSEGLVVFTSRCWKSDRGFYNRFTGEFTPAEGVTMTAEEQESYVSAMKKLVGYKLDSTPLVVENDFFDYVFGNG